MSLRSVVLQSKTSAIPHCRIPGEATSKNRNKNTERSIIVIEQHNNAKLMDKPTKQKRHRTRCRILIKCRTFNLFLETSHPGPHQARYFSTKQVKNHVHLSWLTSQKRRRNALHNEHTPTEREKNKLRSTGLRQI